MEVAPPSSFSQVSALFNDTTEQQRQQQLLGIFPIETPNIHFHSSDFQQAASHTGLDKDFRTADNKEGHRLLNGPLLYPFQNKAQIFNHKFDPFYFDGSELDENFNVQENLIGTPLGASTLEDPRMSYVKNMLQMKELHGANHPLDDSYIKELFMVNAEKGSNYYQIQLDKIDAAMSHYSRMGRYSKQKPLHDIQFTQNLATGNPIHEKHTARIEYESPSDHGVIQHSRRAKRMTRIDDMTAPYHIVAVNRPQRGLRRGSRSTTAHSGDDLLSVSTSSTHDGIVPLYDANIDDYGDEEHKIDTREEEEKYDRELTLSSLGTPNVNVIPTPKAHRQQNDQRQYPSTELSPDSQAILDADNFLLQFEQGLEAVRKGESVTTPQFSALSPNATIEDLRSASTQSEFSRNELTMTPMRKTRLFPKSAAKIKGTPYSPNQMNEWEKQYQAEAEVRAKGYEMVEMNHQNSMNPKMITPSKDLFLSARKSSMSDQTTILGQLSDRSSLQGELAAPAPTLSPETPLNQRALNNSFNAEGLSPASGLIASVMSTADSATLSPRLSTVTFFQRGAEFFRATTARTGWVSDQISGLGPDRFAQLLRNHG